MIKTEDRCVGCEHCGHCGAKHTEVMYCDRCGQEISDFEDVKHLDGGDYHFDCWLEEVGYGESLTLENAEKYGEKHTKEVELNGFYGSIFTADEIEEILKREFLGLPKDQQTACIEDTADWDKEEWLEAVTD